ncbi:protein FAM151A-like isoform X2 [Paramacrobiotus metropolitanus]|uniref:protein FAM151A-like isoform X2 n=1 Tax=Paramacrobiotus metropolitanus TaxID=2943436 RepID=UPI002445E690|nr:protein FAM151A-like isoform X2 [Paramacrobiotus metropolitanus]
MTLIWVVVILVISGRSEALYNAMGPDLNKSYMDALAFFNKPNDASEITWAHAVNSRRRLENALDDVSVQMLEADVSLQRESDGELVPFMAHSSDDPSDITLGEWISLVIENGRKGIKLDFKSIDVVPPSVAILQRHSHNLSVPLWLNADIIGAGPVNAPGIGVNAQQFLVAAYKFAQSVLSIGWVTNCPTQSCDVGKYSWKHVKQMLDVIRQQPDSTQPVTFPIRAVFALNSVRQLRWLADLIPGRKPTFTLWTNIADVEYTRVSDLLLFRTQFPADKVYYDLFDWMMAEFHDRKKDFLPNSAVERPLLHDILTQFYMTALPQYSYMGTNSVLLLNGHGLLVNSQKSLIINDKSEVTFRFAFGDNLSSNNRLTTVLPNWPPGVKNALRLVVAVDGSVSLQSGTFAINWDDSDANLKQLARLEWTGNQITSYTVPPLQSSDILTVTAVDDIRSCARTFRLQINDGVASSLSNTPLNCCVEQVSATSANNYGGLAIHFDGVAGSFAAIENILQM